MIAFVAPAAESQQSDSTIKPKECVDEARRLLIINNSAANLDSLQATLLLVRENRTYKNTLLLAHIKISGRIKR